MSQNSFADLGVSSAVCRPWPSPGSPSRSRSRATVIGDVLAGRDVLAKSPTGSGKTLAFVSRSSTASRRRTAAPRR